MAEDPRCCGSGTCIINDEGHCWCGQQWDGDKMCFPAQATQATQATQANQTTDSTQDASDTRSSTGDS